jgi:hypothetical protein
MDSPLINIITRVSRKNKFFRCYKSIHNQTYKNINHICTYQNDDMGEFLSNFDNLNLVRVPNLKKIDGLYYTYHHHPLTDNFINPDWSFMNRMINSGEGITPIPVREVKFEKNGFYCYTLTQTIRVKFQHFPYNIFNKIAETKVETGWILYLDDDDYFCDEDVLIKIIQEIKNYNDDTLHILKVKNKYGTSPCVNYWNYMKTGHPFILNEIGTSHFIFHSKFLEYTAWDEWSGADYRTAKNLERVIKNKNFVDFVIVYSEGNNGNNVDV